MRFLFLLLFAVMLCNPQVVAAWVSPHPLEWEQEAPAALIPFPQKVEWKDGCVSVPSAGGWMLRGNVKKSDAINIAWAGILKDCSGKSRNILAVTLEKSQDGLPAEALEQGYRLSVTPDGVLLRAASDAGFFYGLQTLRQLAVNGRPLRCCEITDWPAFRYRGYLQDCGRNFRKIERLKKELDLAAQLKVNLFHWHLTDNPGWRVQCKSYPKLNDPKYRTRDFNDTYSYAQIREVVEYARERHITVIPELDMPGHSKYFNKAFGFAMHSPEGMKIIGETIDNRYT